MKTKKAVYFNEYNILMGGNTTYLPLVSGILRSYAEESTKILDSYSFQKFIFHVDSVENIIAQYTVQPFLAAFSLLMWNEQLSLTVAREIKKKYPECIIVFGGASVPHNAVNFMNKFNFVDVCIRGEGEESFTDLLEYLVDNKPLNNLPGLVFRNKNGKVCNNEGERPNNRDLDIYPSPYLMGIFDEVIKDNSHFDFQAIIETNRGCPFQCTYCYWGKGGLSRKYRFHSLERVRDEIVWMGKNKIGYVFNADSNFGMHRRDIEIAKYLVDTKKEFGFPEKFRTCYGKNTDDKIFKVAKLLRDNNLEKGITVSYQSFDSQVQVNIKRKNIKISSAHNLQSRFNKENVPVYTELILGLPGESVETWKFGIDKIFESGLKNQLFVYICQVYPNTELDDSNYREEFGVITKSIELNEIHGLIRSQKYVTEYENIIVQTNSMPIADWKKMLKFSWIVMLFQGLKIGFFITRYLNDILNISYSDFLWFISDMEWKDQKYSIFFQELSELEGKVDYILEGGGRGCVMKEFSDIYWEPEEASFLRLAGDFDAFIDELHSLTRFFLLKRNKEFCEEELMDVVQYQSMCLPRVNLPSITNRVFSYNVPEYFESCFSSNTIPLVKKQQVFEVEPRDYKGDILKFSRESLLWARKSGNILEIGKWLDV